MSTRMCFQAYGSLAELYLSQKKLDQARAEFERLAVRQPKAVGPPTMIAIIYGAQGNWKEARRQYEKVLQIDDHAVVAANNLAYIYARDGTNLDVALQLAQTAKSALPDVPEVNDTLGYVYVRKGLGSLAVPPLEAGVRKDPKNPLLLLHLGQAYALTGEKAKAKKALEARWQSAGRSKAPKRRGRHLGRYSGLSLARRCSDDKSHRKRCLRD